MQNKLYKARVVGGTSRGQRSVVRGQRTEDSLKIRRLAGELVRKIKEQDGWMSEVRGLFKD